MKDEKIKSINLIYLLGYIFVPIIVCAICYIIGIIFFPKGTGAAILFMCPPFAAFIWWVFGGTAIFKIKTKQFEKELDDQKFNRNQSFYGRGKIVIIDLKKGEIGLLFFWNPFKPYVVPASRVTESYVDDGKSGSGFMEGSFRVRFVFKVDDTRINVDTFTSNQRFRMDSDYILTGISKADMMVKMIEEAKSNCK